MALAACAVLTVLQVRYWKNTVALFSHVAAVSKQNYVADYAIGCEVMAQGNYVRAIRCFNLSLANSPSKALRSIRSRTFNNIGYAYLHEGQVSNALFSLEQAVALKPNFPEAYYTLGRAYLTNRQPDLAVDAFQKALAQDPTVAVIHYSLGETLLQGGRPREAQACLEHAVQLRPDWPEAHYKLANALAQSGQLNDAVAHYQEALKLRPAYDQAANNLAWLLATSTAPGVRNGPRALELALQADAHSGSNNPIIAGTLAAAYAESGKFADAIAAASARGNWPWPKPTAFWLTPSKPSCAFTKAARLCGKTPMTSNPPLTPSRPWLAAALLVAMTLLAYQPVWRGAFIWDDNLLIVYNPLLHQSDGWWRLWCTKVVDFVPAVSTAWWLEWRLWGISPAPYHWVNLALHALNAVLLWRVLLRLNIPGSWLAAALFALHPVNVETAAWVAEQKNTWLWPSCLGAALLYLRFEDTSQRRWYWLSACVFLLALSAKTAVAPFPAILLGAAWWRRGRISRTDVLRSALFFALAAAGVVGAFWIQRGGGELGAAGQHGLALAWQARDGPFGFTSIRYCCRCACSPFIPNGRSTPPIHSLISLWFWPRWY